jgi:hypothetical protein
MNKPLGHCQVAVHSGGVMQYFWLDSHLIWDGALQEQSKGEGMYLNCMI